ncbi:MAG TPA: hypothetical protein VJ714_04215 [Anaerolineae bacterium]|nr:hypothetical protein [Anaerolineae bacterium]
MYTRFLWGLRGYVRNTISLEEAQATVRQRMAEREANFLRLVQRGIFGYPRSPYLPLLKLAGCELGDIENLVREKGLEGTLLTLREAGVYFTFEESKGREPIVRGGQVISARPADFNNPFLSHYYYVESGGSTGAGTRVPTDLDHMAANASTIMLGLDAHGTLGLPSAFWYGVLPDSSGPNAVLRHVRCGEVVHKWFSPIMPGDLRPSLKNRLATRLIVSLGQFYGAPIPAPEPVHLDEAAVVARWMAETVQTHGGCVLRTNVSKALRVCVAAREEGINLAGTIFMGGGEPPTPAKVQQITGSGARWVPTYFFTEVGAVGWGCARPVDSNDIHLFKDALALIQYPRRVPGSDITVEAFHFTSLLPTAPKLMLNVESDDYGTIETRSCGCPLETYGFTEHLRHVKSYRKLTGEGVTLVGGEMVHVLEEVLPARFGGSPLDYQLLEEEDEQGFTRLSLVISPKVEIADEAEVVLTVLEALGHGSDAADQARALWSQAGSLRVKRAEPAWTSRGKLMPLRLTRDSRNSTGPLPD